MINVLCFNTISFASEKASEIPGNASATDAEFIPSDAPKINAEAAIVMDIDTGDILYEKNPYQEKYPASITKVLTCLIAIEQGNLNDTLTITDSTMNAIEEGSSSIGLQAGEKLSFKDAMYGMMLNSGNECAVAIAENLGGSVSGFADMMNSKVKELGCKNSHFVNPNGLQNKEHYTSCYDMALIGRAAYQYPEFKEIISCQSYTIPKTNKNEARNLWQENRLIYEGNEDYYYEYCTGGKTGYTETALATLISFAEKDGKRLVCVVMKCNPTTESYVDSYKLFEFCFSRYSLYKPFMDYKINQINKNSTTLLSNYYDDLNHNLVKYSVNESYAFYVRSFIHNEDIEKHFEYYPKSIDGKAGVIRFLYNNEQIGQTDLYVDIPYIDASSTDAIQKKKMAPKKESSILIWAKRIIVILIVSIIILLLFIIYIKVHRWAQYRQTKRNVKYFPRSRDARIKENQERLKKEREEIEKEQEKLRKKRLKERE